MRAFTIVEFLMSFLILSLIAGGIFMITNISILSWFTNRGMLELVQDVRQSMHGMTREIRQLKRESGRNLNITSADGFESTSGPKIEFYIPDYANKISYYLQDNQLIREYPTNTNLVLANAITGLNFSCIGGSSCQDAPVVQIQIRAIRNMRGTDLCFPSPCNPPVWLTEDVKIRN